MPALMVDMTAVLGRGRAQVSVALLLAGSRAGWPVGGAGEQAEAHLRPGWRRAPLLPAGCRPDEGQVGRVRQGGAVVHLQQQRLLPAPAQHLVRLDNSGDSPGNPRPGRRQAGRSPRCGSPGLCRPPLLPAGPTRAQRDLPAHAAPPAPPEAVQPGGQGNRVTRRGRGGREAVERGNTVKTL
ncbi:hypothetical protein HaLaN_13032 [Haematococcus lacustris]|uniref:Uncharacterized protein n=1 Tax=Haematococcus lacustris TaxID=44745 RepID=A0A699ZBG4_HAELA|nr:hypothetical protein HaLaN_13032 [Haematococcus lacustris]